MKLTDIFEYNEEFERLENPATQVQASYDGTEWIIQYEVTELAIRRHIHSPDLNTGIKMIMNNIIETCIWETKDNV